MSEAKIFEIKQAVEVCLVPKLAKKFDDEIQHFHYDVHKKKLNKQIQVLRELLASRNVLKDHINSSGVLSSLLLLYIELQTEGVWNTDKSLEWSNFLNSDIETLYEITLNGLLRSSSSFNGQEIFDKFLEKLHDKLTLRELNYYPSLIEVYCLFIKDLKEYNVQVSPMKTLPISLFLIDDFKTNYKIKGLICCRTILQCLTQAHFTTGNYHQVIYLSLTNVLREKDLEVTKLALECLSDFIKYLPLSSKNTTMDDLLFKILEEVYIESNFYRKAAILEIMTTLIGSHGINCVKKKKKFNHIIIENMSLSANNTSIRDVLLQNCLECLEVWIKHCWAAWNYKTDIKLLSELLKVLHALDESELKLAEKVQNLMVTLMCLCDEDEQKDLLSSLQNVYHSKKTFSVRLEMVLKCFCNA